MSLTSFIETKDVRAKMNQLFKKPRTKITHDIVAPPKTKNYSLVGTAFDYLLRFQLQYWYPSAVSKTWVASHASSILQDTPSYEVVVSALRICKEQHAQFLESGIVNKGLLRACIVLAKLDVVFRRSVLVADLLQYNESDLQDLRQLLKVVPRNVFDHQNICLLDPTFGIGSVLVGGADVDLVIDDMIIDIKTTKNPSLQRKHFNQIIGYYMLYRIGNLEETPKTHKVKKVGIYFSRYAELMLFDVAEVAPQNVLDEFMPWFVNKAKATFHHS